MKEDGKKYESLVPLPEVISACMGYSTASKKVQGCFEQMLQDVYKRQVFMSVSEDNYLSVF